MKTKSLFSYIVLLLLISGCIPVSPIPTIVPTSEPTATLQPKPQPIESWTGMKQGWTVYWKPPSLYNPYYDPSGYLWVFNARGAYRWNVENGELDFFTQADGLPANISDFHAFEEKMWASTRNGIIATYDGEIWTEEKLSEKGLGSFTETPGRLWVYSDDKQSFYYEDGQWNEFKDKPEEWPSDRPPLRVRSQSKDGRLWFNEWNETWSFDGETWKKYDNLSDVRFLYTSPDGTVFFVFHDIILLYDGQEFSPVIFPGNYYTYGMNNQFPTSNGDLWVDKYNDDEFAYLVKSDGSVEKEQYKPVPTPEKLGEPTLYERGWTNDGILMSHDQEIGLYKDGTLETFTVNGEDFNPIIGSHGYIGFSPDGALWLRKNSDGNLGRYDGSTIQYPFDEYLAEYRPRYNVKINSEGELWAAGETELIKFSMGEKPVKYKVNMYLSDFFFAPDGSIWVEDYEGFIARIDPQDLSVKTVLNTYYIQIGEGVVGQDLPARAIKAAPNGDLWVYVDEAGFFRYDGKSWKFFRLGEVGNASNFAINSRGEIWVGQTNHLSHFDGQEWIKHERNCICPSDLTIAPDDTVWFITGCDGVMHFDGNVWTHYPREKELSGISPYDVVSAPDGAMWFISGEAWIRYQP